MRNALLAVSALLAAGFASPARAADPPIVFQAHPAARVLDELRAAADLIGGEKGVKAVNREIKNLFGDRGFEGLDIGRPIVGYVVLAPKPQDITAVVALPITGEKEFMDLCERANKRKVVPAGKSKDVYELPPLDTRYKALLRFSNQYAYIAYGFNPAPALDPQALVPVPRLYDPGEKGIIAGRIYPGRVPLAVMLAAPTLVDEVKKTVLGALGLNGRGNDELVKAVMPEVEKLFARYVKLLPGVESVTARLNVDIPTGDVVVEAVLAGKPGSDLSALVAGFKPTGNKFGGLITSPDTAAGFKLRLPLFEEEIRSAAAAGIEVGRKEATRNVQGAGKDALEELFKSLTRTVKTGEFDLAGAVRGPDKDGWFTAVGAVALEDAPTLGKAFRKYVENNPPGGDEKIEWDAAKAGEVGIHTLKITPGGFLDVTKVFGGADCTVAFAFAPHGVFGAIGPDAVNTLKDALAVKPAPSPVFEIVMNPARVVKAVAKMNGPNDPSNARIEATLGREDKLVSAVSVTLEGGKELKATLRVNLRLLPRAVLFDDIERADRRADEEPAPKPEKK